MFWTLITRWWFQIFFHVYPYLGKWSNLTNILQMGWNHQLDNHIFKMPTIHTCQDGVAEGPWSWYGRRKPDLSSGYPVSSKWNALLKCSLFRGHVYFRGGTGTPNKFNIEPEVLLDTPLKFYESGFPWRLIIRTGCISPSPSSFWLP